MQTQLGAQISDHPQAVVGSRGRMIQSYIALGLGGALLLAGLVAFLVMAEASGQQALLCLGLPGLCVAGIGLLGFFDARSTRDMSLRLYERGLHYADKAGQKTWAWEDIEQVIQHVTVQPQTQAVRRAYQLVHRNGDTLMFYDHVRNPEGAIGTIRQRVYPLLLPRLAATIDAGGSVAFGAVMIEPAGLRVKGRAIPWGDIAGVRQSGGELMIDRVGGGWFNDIQLGLGEVANTELMLQLVARRQIGP